MDNYNLVTIGKTIGKTCKTKLRIPKPAGIAVTSPAILKMAVTKLCGTRRVQPGKVITLLRQKYVLDSLRADERRKARMQADVDKKARVHLKKGIKFNNLIPLPLPSYPIQNILDQHYLHLLQDVEEPLARTKQDLEDQLKILGNAKLTSYTYLKRQYSAREARATIDKFTYPEIGIIYRDKKGKRLKMTPSNGEAKHQYLKQLVLLMMRADGRRQPSTAFATTLAGLVRVNPIINLASTDPLSTKAKAVLDLDIGLKVAQSDDPWLVNLDLEYVGKLCFLHDISLRHKLYRICRIAFWPSTKKRYSSWEGTMELYMPMRTEACTSLTTTSCSCRMGQL